MFARLFSDLPQHTTLRRLASLRLLALASQCLALMLARWVLGIELPLKALSLVLLIGIGVIAWTAWRMRQPNPMRESGIFAQLLLDLFNWSALLYLCGGATNPFVSFYLAILAVAAAMLTARWVALLALLSLLAYTALSYWYLPLQLANSEHAVSYHLAGMWFNFALSAGVISWFVTRISATLRAREAQLAQARERQLQHAQVLALGTQAASAAHAIASPLSTIAVLVGELRHSARHVPQLQTYDEDFALIEAQLRACQQGLAQMRAPQDGKAETALSLLLWLRSFLENWRLQHPQQQLTLQVDVSNQQAEQMLAPTAQLALAQILTVLLDNAYTSAPTGNTTIQLFQEAGQTSHLTLAVQDQGQGIRADLLPRLGHAPVPSSTGGQGIGLWLASVAAQQLGSQLRFENMAKAESDSGKGTRVLMQLPFTLPINHAANEGQR